MSALQKVYDVAPLPFQNLMATVSGVQKNRSRYGRTYWEHRAWLERYDKWTLEQKLDHQDQLTRNFVRYAAKRSPFYRALYAGVDLSEIRGAHDLQLLPTVDKEDLRVNAETVRTIPRKGAVEGHTGGTTGKSLVVLNHPADGMRRMATLDHFKAKAGFENRKMRRATFMGKHIVPPGREAQDLWRYNAATRQMLYSSFHLTEENLGRYVDSLNRFKPEAIDGFFMSMVDVASYVLRHGKSLDFRPVAMFPTAETVTPHGRKLIEEAFGSKVYDQYASSEGAPFVTECAAGTLHIEPHSGVFEHETPGLDEVLITSFTTHGTPLIRYAIGDSMIFGPTGECACGISSPTVTAIEGRKDDFLYTPSGGRINAGDVANLFKSMPNSLVRAQLLQDSMDSVTALLEVDEMRYDPKHDDLLRDEFRHKFGSRAVLHVRHVSEIPREKSGKLRFIKNLLARQ